MKVKTTGKTENGFITVEQTLVGDDGERLSIDDICTEAENDMLDIRLDYLFKEFLNSLSDTQHDLYHQVMELADRIHDKSGMLQKQFNAAVEEKVKRILKEKQK